MPKPLSQHPGVRSDLVEIHGFIAADNPDAADRVVDAIKMVFPPSRALYADHSSGMITRHGNGLH